jgi:crotonobetainyl-CoA:carnitine CoA-transferase CaiB-like acyl-CoA transferase
VTNVRPGSVARLGFDYDNVRKTNPGIVLPDHRIRPDTPTATARPTTWARSGAAGWRARWCRDSDAAAAAAGRHGRPHDRPRRGRGDPAALYRREQSGERQRVAISLMRLGAYMMGWDYNTVLRANMPINAYDRFHAPNPIINCYRAGDGRWFWLLLLQGDRHWPDVLRAVGRPDLGEDERFANIMSRAMNAEALVRELDATFATKPLSHWTEAFDREDVW